MRVLKVEIVERRFVLNIVERLEIPAFTVEKFDSDMLDSVEKFNPVVVDRVERPTLSVLNSLPTTVEYDEIDL